MATTINSNTTDGIVITPDTSGEIELQANGVTKAKVTANGLQDANGASIRGGSFRNLIINGDMHIAQRGTSVSGITSSSGNYDTIDRFQSVIRTVGTWTNTQDTDVPTSQGFSNSVKWDCTTANASLSADSWLRWQTQLEAQNLQHLKFGTASAETLTLSFWVKSNKTGTYIVEFYQPDSGRALSKSYTISAADTWEKKTITVDNDTSGQIDNNNASGFIVTYWFGAGSNYTSGTLQTSWGAITTANRAVGQVNLADSTSNYINITGVQLEVGEGASDFEFLPYDVQLARCQRYYEMSYSQGTALGTVTQNGAEMWLSNRNPGAPHHYLKFRTIKRANPTITIYNPTTGATGSFRNLDAGTNPSAVISRTGHKGSTIYTGTSTNLGQFMQFHYTADVEL